MDEYKMYTNDELETEVGILKSEYNEAQTLAIEYYKKMLELSEKYMVISDILLARNGNKKD